MYGLERAPPIRYSHQSFCRASIGWIASTVGFLGDWASEDESPPSQEQLTISRIVRALSGYSSIHRVALKKEISLPGRLQIAVGAVQ